VKPYIDRQIFGRVLDEIAAASEKCACGRPLALYGDDEGRCMPCHRPDIYGDQRRHTSAANLRRAA
jgi:hypothetical protein